jgi:hypothetical protein
MVGQRRFARKVKEMVKVIAMDLEDSSGRKMLPNLKSNIQQCHNVISYSWFVSV